MFVSGNTVTISDAAKILTQIDIEREELDKESMSLTEEINHILSEAFDKVNPWARSKSNSFGVELTWNKRP